MNTIKKYELSLTVLDYLSKVNKDKYILMSNLIGFAGERGSLEAFLNKDFSVEDKSQLDIVLSELQEKSLIQPAFRDIVNRGSDLIISDKGRIALQKKSLDTLDEMLLTIDSSGSLVQKRYGAYDAVLSKHTDWQRHVASSLVELIDQTLQTVAPNVSIKTNDKTEQGSVRKAKIRTYLLQKLGRRSESIEKVVEKAFDLIESCRVRLEAIKHNRAINSSNEVESLIKLTEDSLYYMFDK